MKSANANRIRRPRRIVSDCVSLLIALMLLYVVCAGIFAGPVRRARRIADKSVFSLCTAAAYLTARYDAQKIADLLELDADDTAVSVLTAMSNLNTLTPMQTLSTCARYRGILRTLINRDSLTVAQQTLSPVGGGAPIPCTLYTIAPTEAQMTAFIEKLAENMETDGGLFVLSRAFYTALMMVAQDATEVMAINAFENAWKSLSGADSAHVEATAKRLLGNNFPITFAAKGDRVYAFDASLSFEDSPVDLSYDSSGTLPGTRSDRILLVVEDTGMGFFNTCAFALGEGFSGELTTTDGDETETFTYGRAGEETDG